MISLRVVVVAVVAMSSLATACADSCTLATLPINPIEPERIDTFVGKSKDIEVRFINERTEGNIDVFPEPPLMIKNNRTNTTCLIDGGVWVRKSVFVNQDDTVLVTQEFSGSNDFLNFYNTSTCEKLYTIDISNATWEIRESEISVSKHIIAAGKAHGEKIAYRLNASCEPVVVSK